MRVIGAARFGGPEVLEEFEVAEPHAGPGELRIRVRAASVNPADLGVRSGRGRGAQIAAGRVPPYVPGMDVAGVVDEVGPGVTRFAVHDQVMAVVLPSRPAGGAYAEFVVLPASSVAAAPDGLELARAATIPMNGLTAWRALDLLDLPAGARLLVTGAGGALGGYVVQLARERGLRVLAVVEARDTERVRGYGADVLLPREGFEQVVRTEAPEGVDGIIDAAVLNDRVLPLVRDGGSVASVRQWTPTPPRGIHVLDVKVSDYAHRADLLEELRERVERGAFVPCGAEELPAAHAPQAHRRMEAGAVRGRLVLTF